MFEEEAFLEYGLEIYNIFFTCGRPAAAAAAATTCGVGAGGACAACCCAAAAAWAAATAPGCKWPSKSAPCHLNRGAVPNMPKGVCRNGFPAAAAAAARPG